MADSKFVFNNPGTINIQDNSTTTNNVQSGIIGSGTVNIYQQSGEPKVAANDADEPSSNTRENDHAKETADIKEFLD